jgi:hypothetical protein
MWLAISNVSSSMGNVVVVFATAASLTAEQVGATALALAAYLLALSLVRGVVGDPALLTLKTGSVDEVAGAAVLVGICCAPLSFGILWLLLPGYRFLAIAISIALPFLLMQDALRYIAFAKKRPKLAAISDISWFVLTSVPAIVFLSVGLGDVLSFVGPWMGGGVLASFVLCRQLEGRIDLRAGWRSLTRERRLRAATTIDSLATNGVQQIALLEVAAVASLEGTGAIRFLQACFGPVTLIFTTMYVDSLWSVRASQKEQNVEVRRVAFKMALVISVSTIAMFTFLQFLPLHIGTSLAGSTFVETRDILLLFAFAQVAAGLGAGPVSALRFAQHTGDATRIRLYWAALLIVGTAVGSAIAGAAGFCVALLVANVAAGVAWWWRLGVVTRRPRMTKRPT